jgi:hypothetical protein
METMSRCPSGKEQESSNACTKENQLGLAPQESANADNSDNSQRGVGSCHAEKPWLNSPDIHKYYG